MATLSASSSSMPLSVLYSARGSSSKPKPPRVVASFGEVVGKDMEFLKKRIGRGVQWANGALRIPQLSKSLDRLLWLRMTEDPLAASLPPPSWPQPSYPGLCWILFISLFVCVICLFWRWIAWGFLAGLMVEKTRETERNDSWKSLCLMLFAFRKGKC